MTSSSSVPDGFPSPSDSVDPGTPNDRSSLVVFVPGLGLDSRSSQLVRHQLGGRSTVVLLPSLGLAAAHRANLSVQRQAERLLQSLPTGETSILVGHSASCPVVVEAASNSNDVLGLVLIGPVTDPTAQTWPKMLRQWARTASHERLSEAPVLLPQYRRTGILSMLRGMDTMRHFRTDLALSRLDVPVEIVRGANDLIASHEWSAVLRQACGGRLTTTDGAAHMVPITHAAAVAAAVDRIRLEIDQVPASPR